MSILMSFFCNIFSHEIIIITNQFIIEKITTLINLIYFLTLEFYFFGDLKGWGGGVWIPSMFIKTLHRPI